MKNTNITTHPNKQREKWIEKQGKKNPQMIPKKL